MLTKLFIFPIHPAELERWRSRKNFFKNAAVGGATGIFTALTGIATPNWFAYGPFPIILVTGCITRRSPIS